MAQVSAGPGDPAQLVRQLSGGSRPVAAALIAGLILLLAYAGAWVTFDERSLGAGGLSELEGVTSDMEQLRVEETSGEGLGLGIDPYSNSLEVSGDLTGAETVGPILPLLAVTAIGGAFGFGRNRDSRLAMVVIACGALAFALTALKLIAIGQASNSEELSNWAPWLALLASGAIAVAGLQMARSPAPPSPVAGPPSD